MGKRVDTQSVTDPTNQDGGGAPPENQPDSGNNDNPPKPTDGNDDSVTMSKRDQKRLIDDLHKFKSEVKDLKVKEEARERQRLADENRWKELSESWQKKAEEAEAKSERRNKAFLDTLRGQEIRAAAMQSGIKQEALSDLDLVGADDLEVEFTSAGRYMVNGTKQFVEKLKKTRPHWFNDSTPPKVNPGGGGKPPEPTKVTASDVVSAQNRFGRRSPQYLKVREAYEKQRKG